MKTKKRLYKVDDVMLTMDSLAEQEENFDKDIERFISEVNKEHYIPAYRIASINKRIDRIAYLLSVLGGFVDVEEYISRKKDEVFEAVEKAKNILKARAEKKGKSVRLTHYMDVDDVYFVELIDKDGNVEVKKLAHNGELFKYI